MQTGEWPEADIDHADGDRSNNSWRNLRQATRQQNNRNRRDTKGVMYDAVNKAWLAYIYTGTRSVRRRFSTELAARNWRLNQEAEHFGAFAPSQRAA